MKLSIFGNITPVFRGRREDRNTIQQLKQDNDYSLTENNQIKINNAIDNLSKESGEKNIKFLIDVAENLQYGTNIEIGKESRQNWKQKLYNAANQSLAISDPIIQDKYRPIIQKSMSSHKLSDDEKNIIETRKNILSQLDMSQLRDEKNTNIKRVQSNLDYFIASSSTSTKTKKYILNRLDYMLSPEYKINPQLENKKTKVFAEIINDLVINTKESNVPNTKSIHQKQHGMCAAISTARKLMSYEDKANFVDNILSELDASPNLMVYDKTQIGKHIKVPVKKIEVDFEDAEKKGYRIIDASTTQWMNVAQMYGADNTPKYEYTPFDRTHLGAYNDSINIVPIDDDTLVNKHKYFQALVKAKDVIGDAKEGKLVKDLKDAKNRQNYNVNIKHINAVYECMRKSLKEVIPDISSEELHSTTKDIISLQVKYSDDIKKSNDYIKEYKYIPNEEPLIKDKKVKNYLSDKFADRVNNKNLDKNVTNIRDLAESASKISKEISPNPTISERVRKNRRLYEAAVAYRNCLTRAMNDDEYMTDFMIEYNVPDKESLLVNNVNKTIKHIEKTGDQRYLSHFDLNKEDTLQSLNEIKEGLNIMLTEKLDDLYYAIGFVDRKHALLFDVIANKEAVKNNDKDKTEKLAFAFDVKASDKNKIIDRLNKFSTKLENGATDEEYIEIYNKMGYKNQLKSFAELYTQTYNAVMNPEDKHNEIILSNIKYANQLPEDTPITNIQDILNDAGNLFNTISSGISNIQQAMNVIDENNNLLINSASEKMNTLDYIARKDDGLIPITELITLRDHFDKIDNMKSQDEFSSRQGKLSDPSLYKFSKNEKNTLHKIEKSLNRMYSNVNKELNLVYSDIQAPLEEHVRKTGVDSGSYWVGKDGHSGLRSEQEAKILQQMSDRKYRITENKDKIIDVVKNSPHSVITSTSVFHDKIGAHAQYVAEISPAGKNGKDVLYHDNTWGVSEKENIWVDSEGLTRTDYSDRRGGEDGYITNDKYRNGNYVEDLLYKSGQVINEEIENKQLKKISNQGPEWRFPGIFDAIISEDGGNIKSVTSSIKDNIFSPDTNFISDFKSVAKKMTKAEIKAAITKNMTIGENYNIQYDKMRKRILPSQFNEGIKSEADYNALADNDPIKIYFEKAALYKSIPHCIDWEDFAKAETLEDVEKFRKVRDENAKSYFNYSFGKEKEILYAYALNKEISHAGDIVSDAAKNNNIRLSNKQINDIITNTAVYTSEEKKEFDGSLKNTISFMVNKTLKKFDKVVPDSEDARKAKAEIKENLTNSLSNALYYNESDIDNKSIKARGISQFIDRKFNPETNEDFVKIYRNLQDMTIEEFNKVTEDVRPEELGIKEMTGYEVIRRYIGSDESTEKTIKNLIFQNEYVKNADMSKHTPTYKYNKLYKHKQGVIYAGQRTFDDLYRDYYFSLQNFELQKAFNQYKGEGFRKYGSIPAYPTKGIIDDDAFENKLNIINDSVQTKVDTLYTMKNTKKLYNINNSLNKALSNIPDDETLSQSQYRMINRLANKFMTLTATDDTIPASTQAAENLVNLSPNARAKEFKAAYEPMHEEMCSLESATSNEIIDSLFVDELKELKTQFRSILDTEIPAKYKDIVKQDINKWLNEELKGTKEDKTNQYLDKLSDTIDAYSINQDENSSAKDEYLYNLSYELNSIRMLQNSMDTLILDDTADEHFNKKLGFHKNFEKYISDTCANIYDMTEEYIKNNIDPAHKDKIVGQVNDTVQAAIINKGTNYNPEEVNKAYEKFKEDYRKYHYLSNPLLFLNEYLYKNAKDGEFAELDPKDDDSLLATKSKSLDNMFESALSNAGILEMQNILMDAVGTGNISEIRERFKKQQSPIDTTESLLDNKTIDYMVRSLVIGQNLDTAKMFIEKLGLAESFIQTQNSLYDTKVLKSKVRKIANIYTNTNSQVRVIKDIEQRFNRDFDSEENWEQRLDEAKQEFILRTKNTKPKKNIEYFSNIFDSIKPIIEANTDIPKSALIKEALKVGVDGTISEATERINENQNYVKSYFLIHRLIEELNIPEYSSANVEKEKFNEQYNEVVTFNNDVLSSIDDENTYINIRFRSKNNE